MHCDYNQPHTAIQARSLYQIINHPYTQTPLRVTGINRHHQREIMSGYMKQNHQIYTKNYKNKIKFIFSIAYVNLVCWFHIFPCIKSPSVWRNIAVTCRRVYMYGWFMILYEPCAFVGVCEWLTSRWFKKALWWRSAYHCFPSLCSFRRFITVFIKPRCWTLRSTISASILHVQPRNAFTED